MDYFTILDKLYIRKTNFTLLATRRTTGLIQAYEKLVGCQRRLSNQYLIYRYTARNLATVILIISCFIIEYNL